MYGDRGRQEKYTLMDTPRIKQKPGDISPGLN